MVLLKHFLRRVAIPHEDFKIASNSAMGDGVPFDEATLRICIRNINTNPGCFIGHVEIEGMCAIQVSTLCLGLRVIPHGVGSVIAQTKTADTLA